jgi:long-chain acyl-CoA synthetase
MFERQSPSRNAPSARKEHQPELIDAARVFRENEILVTGANGFLGKVLLGLIFDRYPDFRRLHILVRPKAGRPPAERFEKDALASPPLRALRAPMEKISLLAGDIAEPGCGLSSEDASGLEGRVRLVINCAGLVEFFPPVDESFRSNVDGVENVVALTRRLGARLLHVSTCFVCGEADGLVEESDPIPGFYPRRKHPADHSFRHVQEIRYMRERIREVRESGAGLPPKELAQKLIDLGRQRAAQWGWVNIYTYAKSLGEQLIAAEPGLEWAIVRPAIVEAALEFPFPGWVEGGRTAAPLVMMAMSGVRHWPVRAEAPLEVVPVDQVASSILIAAAALMSGDHGRVYQIATAERNPAKLGALVEWMHAHSRRRRRKLLPAIRGVRILTPRRVKALGDRQQRNLHRLQRTAAALKRLAQRTGLPGRKPLGRLATMLRTLGLQAGFRSQTMELYQPFAHDNRFVFEAENIRRAHARLAPEDRRKLPWSPEKVSWRRYWIDNEVEGVMKWVAPEMTKGRTVQA